LILRGLRSCSAHCLDILTNELTAVMHVANVLIGVAATNSANIQGPAFARPRNIAVSEMLDVAGVHLQQPPQLPPTSLAATAGNRHVWNPPKTVELCLGGVEKLAIRAEVTTDTATAITNLKGGAAVWVSREVDYNLFAIHRFISWLKSVYHNQDSLSSTNFANRTNHQ
jgi:hypothetical protein